MIVHANVLNRNAKASRYSTVRLVDADAQPNQNHVEDTRDGTTLHANVNVKRITSIAMETRDGMKIHVNVNAESLCQLVDARASRNGTTSYANADVHIQNQKVAADTVKFGTIVHAHVAAVQAVQPKDAQEVKFGSKRNASADVQNTWLDQNTVVAENGGTA